MVYETITLRSSFRKGKRKLGSIVKSIWAMGDFLRRRRGGMRESSVGRDPSIQHPLKGPAGCLQQAGEVLLSLRGRASERQGGDMRGQEGL